MIKLSILIPSLKDRGQTLNTILKQLEAQCNGIADIGVWDSFGEGTDVFVHYFHNGVQCIVYIDNREKSIGEKRNTLLELAEGKYSCFVDDDDSLPDNYIELLLGGIEKEADCCSLKGIITTNGGDPRVYEHSLKYSEWRTNGDDAVVKYERPPNHLNCIKSEIAKQFKFPETYHGEDHVWSMAIQKSGLLKTEHYIDQVIYYYNYNSKK